MTNDENTPDLATAQDALRTLRRHMTEVCLRERWGLTLIALGILHLSFFSVGQALFLWPEHRPWHHVTLWFAEVGAILVLLRKMNGRLWFQKSPLAAMILRVWASFLIIDFNAATLNNLTGFSVDWFKLSWTGLSTFGFAVTAWILGWRFLIPAVQMYFTGLLMVRFPRWAYLIYGLSWWVALTGIGLYLERLRNRGAAPTSLGRASASRRLHGPLHQSARSASPVQPGQTAS